MDETMDPTSSRTSAAQADGGINLLLQSILAAMNPGAASNGSAASLQGLLGQLEGSDPTLALIARYLIAQQSAQPAAPTGLGDPSIDPDSPWNFPQSVEGLQRQIMNMNAELEFLWQRNDHLALALGACYLCWGENPACEVCGGVGRPGSARPEKRLFSRWVLPAIRTVKATKEEHAGNSNQIR